MVESIVANLSELISNYRIVPEKVFDLVDKQMSSMRKGSFRLK